MSDRGVLAKEAKYGSVFRIGKSYSKKLKALNLTFASFHLI